MMPTDPPSNVLAYIAANTGRTWSWTRVGVRYILSTKGYYAECDPWYTRGYSGNGVEVSASSCGYETPPHAHYASSGWLTIAGFIVDDFRTLCARNVISSTTHKETT